MRNNNRDRLRRTLKYIEDSKWNVVLITEL